MNIFGSVSYVKSSVALFFSYPALFISMMNIIHHGYRQEIFSSFLVCAFIVLLSLFIMANLVNPAAKTYILSQRFLVLVLVIHFILLLCFYLSFIFFPMYFLVSGFIFYSLGRLVN